MKVLSVVGNRPQFIKSAPTSLALPRTRESTRSCCTRGSTTTASSRRSSSRSSGSPSRSTGSTCEPPTPQAMKPAHPSGAARRSGPTGCSSTATRTRRSRARSAASEQTSRSHTSRPGCAAATSRCPRSATGSRSTASRSCFSAPTSARARSSQAEGVAGRIEVVGDVMADALRPAHARGAEALDALETLGVEPGRYLLLTLHREANAAPTASRPHRRRASTRSRSRSSSRSHPRTRAALAPRGSSSARTSVQPPPLGYLDLTALASQARVILTDSGGLQKEAYWYGVPCVTLRPSTEWVDTVEAGANVLVDDDPERLVEARRGSARCRTSARSSTATARQPRRIADALCTLSGPVRSDERANWDDRRVVGAGYVGVPLAQVFADAGRSSLLVDVQADRRRRAQPRREPHRGRPVRGAASPLVETGAIGRDDRLRLSRATRTRS